MSNPQLGSVAAAAQSLAKPTEDKKLASFTFILESRNGYTAEGCYPNVTPEQYKLVVAVLEGKFDQPKIITGVR